MLGALHCAQEDVLGGVVGDKAGRGDEANKRKTVTDTLEKGTSRSKGRRGDVGATEIIDNDTHQKVDGGHRTLTDIHGLVVVLRVTHLRDDSEECRSASIGEDEGVDGVHTLDESWVSNQLVVGDVRSTLGCFCRAILEADGNSQGQEGDDYRNHTSPCKPRDLSQGSNRASQETNGCSYCNENSGASSVERQGVEGSRDT